jgi:acetyl esterase/lipase
MRRTISTIDSSCLSRKYLDVRYSDVSPNQLLDVYLPETGDGPFPVIVFVHGGGFLGGRKDYGTLADILPCVSQGYALVSVEYRLSMEAKWPACVHDVKAALRFITANAGELELDPDRMVLWGSSAGAGITTSIAATLGNGKVDDPALGYPDIRPHVAAMVGWFPLTDWISAAHHHNIPNELTTAVASPTSADAQQYAAEGWKHVEDAALGFAIEDDLPRAFAASPITMVEGAFVPSLLLHGTADVVVPFVDTVRLAQKVNTRVQPGLVTVWPMIGQNHGASCFGTPDTIVATLRWIDRQIGRTHEYTDMQKVSTISMQIDDQVELPADDLSLLPGLTVVPTRSLEPIRNRLEFWGPVIAQPDVPQGV